MEFQIATLKLLVFCFVVLLAQNLVLPAQAETVKNIAVLEIGQVAPDLFGKQALGKRHLL